MALTRFALFYRQDFQGGYRYLDHCGEFLVQAEQEYGLFPTGDAAPQGGELEAPDVGVKVEVNSSLLRVTQEFPGDETSRFENYSTALANLYQELFTPTSIERMGVAVQAYAGCSTFKEAEARSLEWGAKLFGQSEEKIGKTFGMIPAAQNVDGTFRSGSRELRVKVRPITFERVKLNRRTAPGGVTKSKLNRIERQNQGAQRLLGYDLSYAVFLELDLTEENPPANAFADLLSDVLEKEIHLGRLLQ